MGLCVTDCRSGDGQGRSGTDHRVLMCVCVADCRGGYGRGRSRTDHNAIMRVCVVDCRRGDGRGRSGTDRRAVGVVFAAAAGPELRRVLLVALQSTCDAL